MNSKYWQITKHKGLEIQLTNWRSRTKGYLSYPHRFRISFQWCHPRCFDHPGIEFSIEIAGIYFRIEFMDNRHQEDM